MIGDGDDPHARLAHRHFADRMLDLNVVELVVSGDLGREDLHSSGGQGFGRLVPEADQLTVLGMMLGPSEALERADAAASRGLESSMVQDDAAFQRSTRDPNLDDWNTGGGGRRLHICQWYGPWPRASPTCEPGLPYIP